MSTVTPGESTPALYDRTLTPPPRPVPPQKNEAAPAAAPGPSAPAAEPVKATNQRPLEFEVGAELKLRVRFDEPTGRFVYMGVNAKSGEVERQYPPDQALRMIARMREIVGQKLDQEL